VSDIGEETILWFGWLSLLAVLAKRAKRGGGGTDEANVAGGDMTGGPLFVSCFVAILRRKPAIAGDLDVVE